MSTDDLSGAESIAKSLDIPFPVLYDPPANVVKQYGVFNLLGDGLATGSTFIIDKKGVIRWKYVAERYDQLPSTQDVIEQLEMIEG